VVAAELLKRWFYRREDARRAEPLSLRG